MYLIRHAHAQHNITGDTSIFDPQLTELGHIQARSVHAPQVDLVLCSTAARALQTALDMYPHQTIYATDILLEYNTGASCNLRHELSVQKARFPTVDFDRFHVPALPTERTHQDGQVRAKRLVDMLGCLTRPPPTLAMISHGNFLETLVKFLGGQPKAPWENCHIIYVPPAGNCTVDVK